MTRQCAAGNRRRPDRASGRKCHRAGWFVRQWTHGKAAPTKDWSCKTKTKAGWLTGSRRISTKGRLPSPSFCRKAVSQTFTNDNPNLPASKFAAPTHTVTEGQPAIRDLLAITRAEVGKPFVYYFGAGWDRSGDFPDAKAWNGLRPPLRRAPRPAAAGDDWELIAHAP